MRKSKQLAMKTHHEVQRREAIRRDLAERMKFVPPDLRVGERVFYWQEDPSKIPQGRNIWKMCEVEIMAVKGIMGVISTGASILQVSASRIRRPLKTVDLEELPDSRGRTRAPMLWPS